MLILQTKTFKSNSNEVRVPIGWDKSRLDMGIRRKIFWYPSRASPHILAAGQSGSGKTKLLELFASRCVRDIQDVELYLADPKCIDFGYAKNSTRFWSGSESGEALRVFQQSMKSCVEQTDPSGCTDNWNWKILIFDEVAAFTMLQTDKKKRTELQEILSTILLLGRGVRHVVICAVQKALMEYFGSSRSQFGTTLLLGNVDNDKEQVQMLMANYKDTINATPNTRGQFWMTADGEGITRGQVPLIANIDEVRSLILEGLNRN